ncbi:MAG: DUF370 domain-containing protein [Megasphaera sp.]|jgi:hypothetical protein|nr:DUF370 domain-containing protein [Megasphaera sp.]MCH4187523.1 DUF370 domain-containing protein [Megasphaera sp.]MCH4217753.1 DUF370 domain-containing protein [Megasphaera sp.]
MYLHIGGNQVIDVHRIIAMFKAHPRKAGKSNPLQQYYRPLRVVEGEGKIRCYVVTEECIYATPVSLDTLVKRYGDLFSPVH